MQEIETLKNESNGLIHQANIYRVDDQETYTGAAILKKSLSAFKLKLKNIFDPIVSAANMAHKEAKAQQKAQIDPVEVAENILRQKCKDYENDQEKKRLAEEKIRQAEADEKARQKKKNSEEFAEAQGLYEPEGEPELETKPAPVASAPKMNKISGLGIRRTWKAEIVDLAALPKGYMKPDLVKLGEVARRDQDKASIPGVKFYYD